MFCSTIGESPGLGSLRPLLHGLISQFAHFLDEEGLYFIGRPPRSIALPRRRQPKDGFKLREEFRSAFELFHKLLEPCAGKGATLLGRIGFLCRFLLHPTSI